MRIRRLWLLALGFAALSGITPLSAQEPNLYFHAYAWLSGLSGGGHTGGGGGNREFDLEDTLDVDTGKTVPSFEFFIRSGKHRFIVGWSHGAYTGEGALSSSLDYDGRVFPPASSGGSELRSEIDYDLRKLLYARPFFDGRKLTAGILVGVDAYSVESDLRMNGIGSSEVRLKSSVPVVGACMTFYPFRTLRIYGEARGMSIDRGNVDTRFVEWYFGGEWLFIGQSFALSAGYRYTDLQAEDGGRNRFDLRQKGIYTGFVIKF